MQFQVVDPEGLNLQGYQILEVSSRWNRGGPLLPGAIRIDPCFVEAEENTNRYFPRYRNPQDALLNPRLLESLTTLGLVAKRPLLLSSTGPWGPVNGARVAWALCSIGFSDIYWLNGGSRAWTNGSNLIEACGASIPGQCWARPEDFANAKLVDVRSRAEYLGLRDNRYPFFRSLGHIPGALWSGDWTSLVRPDRRLRDREELSRRWQRAGLTQDRDIVFYCGTGWRSSLACCVALWLGYSRVRNYDGGIYDWVSRGLPLSAGKSTPTVEAPSP